MADSRKCSPARRRIAQSTRPLGRETRRRPRPHYCDAIAAVRIDQLACQPPQPAVRERTLETGAITKISCSFARIATCASMVSPAPNQCSSRDASSAQMNRFVSSKGRSRASPAAHRSHVVRPTAPAGQDMLHGQLGGAERRIFAKSQSGVPRSPRPTRCGKRHKGGDHGKADDDGLRTHRAEPLRADWQIAYRETIAF
jgi:hypothetical protein